MRSKALKSFPRIAHVTLRLVCISVGAVLAFLCCGAMPVSASTSINQLGSDIDGEAAGDNSGWSVSLSSDGTILAIGAPLNDETGSAAGHVRVYSISTAAPTVPVPAPIHSFWLLLAGLLIPTMVWRKHQTKRANQWL